MIDDILYEFTFILELGATSDPGQVRAVALDGTQYDIKPVETSAIFVE